jgi:hypothetical protein
VTVRGSLYPCDHLIDIDVAVHKVGKHSIPDKIESGNYDDRDYG